MNKHILYQLDNDFIKEPKFFISHIITVHKLSKFDPAWTVNIIWFNKPVS